MKFLNQKNVDFFLKNQKNHLHVLHFSNNKKINFNHHSIFYGYPLELTWNYYERCLGKYPYASDRKYIFLLKISKEAKIFNLMKEVSKNDLLKFIHFFKKRISFTHEEKKYCDRIDKKIKLNDDIYFHISFFLNEKLKISKNSENLFYFFKNILNYDIILDCGFGRIHHHEPIQLVILNYQRIERYYTFLNPDHYKFYKPFTKNSLS